MTSIKFTSLFYFYSSKPAPQRPHSTAATAPVPTQQSQAQAQPVPVAQSGGMLSNILQTAAGVAVGHTVGRMVSGLFEGNSVDSNSNAAQTTQNTPVQCQADTKRFLDCMQQNYDDVSACQNYLEMLKQCQRQFAQ